MKRLGYDAVVVGGGPAGLAAAIEMRKRGVGKVAVIEREAEPGGIPRHSKHTGFGLRDLRTIMSGPGYARRYARGAIRAGVDVLTSTTVTGIEDSTRLEATSPDGLLSLAADAVLLATGCRERPRSALLVPGDRPAGVLTTGSLQQLVYLAGLRPGKKAVVVGAEHVSFSALLTLHHGGADVVAMVTSHPAHQTHLLYKLPTATRLRVPILSGHELVRIYGRSRVEAVDVADVSSRAERTIACDTVVFTGDWIPDHELARRAAVDIDLGTRGPQIDALGRTSRPGVFAAGNLVHAAEAADVAALGGRAAGVAMATYLDGTMRWSRRVTLICEPPLRWIAPNALSSRDEPVRGRFTMRVDRFVDGGELRICQGDDTLHRRSLRRLRPTLPIKLHASWIADVDLDGPPVRLELVEKASATASPTAL